MSLNLEESTGLTLNPTAAGFSLATTTYSTTVATTPIFNGVFGTAFAVKTTQALPAADFVSGTAFSAMPVGVSQAAVFVFGVNQAGTIQAIKGPNVAWPNSSGTSFGPVSVPFPVLPPTFAPLAYTVIQNGSNGSNWTLGTTIAQTGITTPTIVQLATGISVNPTTT
jgi:hypothetical protein